MSHEPSLATRSWVLAEKHIPNFTGLYAPARNGILAAIAEACRATPPPAPEMDALINDIDRSDAEQGSLTMTTMDPATGRPVGDHGTANDAINFALDTSGGLEADTFLRAWREGDLAEWPDFYEWLAAQERKAAA